MIIGLDEVGRGALAGPLVVGAVGLKRAVHGLKDSKQLSRIQRQKLSLIIYRSAEFVGIGMADSDEIDKLGLTRAHELAYKRAIADYTGELECIIDGNINYLPGLPNVSCIIRADQTVPEVSAASIVAKVFRDNLMIEMAANFPEYGFDTHVGYSTKRHLESLLFFGATSIHRKSYKPVIACINGNA
jgi:ribonuclease HII